MLLYVDYLNVPIHRRQLHRGSGKNALGP